MLCHNGCMTDCLHCTRPATRLGLCNAHYKKLRKYGDPLTGRQIQKGLPRVAYYLSYVDKRGPDDCWPWTGSKSDKGYGTFNAGDSTVPAHRWGFEQFVRVLETGETIDHTCHNRDPDCPGGNTCPHRACQNPAHWKAATDEQNKAMARNTRSLAVTKARDIANAQRQRERFRH